MEVKYIPKVECRHPERELGGSYVDILTKVVNTDEAAVITLHAGETRASTAESLMAVAKTMGLGPYIRTAPYKESRKVHVWFNRAAWESAHVDYCRLCCKSQAREEGSE